MMDYFKAWGEGKLNSILERTLAVNIDVGGANLAQTDSRTLTREESGMAFMATADAECPDQVPVLAQAASFGLLETEPIDDNGVMHMLLRGQEQQLQYMAVRKEADGKLRALVADPPVCVASGSVAFLQPWHLQAMALQPMAAPQVSERDRGGHPEVNHNFSIPTMKL